MIIYKAVNKANGKVYVGKTEKSLEERKRMHEWNALNNGHGYKSKFYNAIRKYGVESFEWSVIDETSKDKEELAEKEKEYILACNSVGMGYNISVGGFGGDNFTNNPNKEEIRKKISESLIGRKMSKSFCEKQSKRCKGKKMSPETIEKMSKAQKGKIITQETRDKIRKKLTGRKVPQEVIDKISKTLTGRKMPPEFGRQISERQKGKTRPFKALKEEHKQKIKQALTGKEFSQEHRDRLKQAWIQRRINMQKNKEENHGQQT